MSADESSSTGMKDAASGLPDPSHVGWMRKRSRSSFSWSVIGSLRQEMSRLLLVDGQRGGRITQDVHDEAAFRFLLANELKRRERSGRSFHILFIYLSGSEGDIVPIGDPMITALLPIISGMLRETDYIGWYQDDHVLGAVLTALGDQSTEQVSGRIEQRLWQRINHEFPAKDFTRLRVRFFQAQEFGVVRGEGFLGALS